MPSESAQVREALMERRASDRPRCEGRPFLLPSPPNPRKAKSTPDTQSRCSARPSRGVAETVEAQAHPGNDSDTKAAGFWDVRGRRYGGVGVPKAYGIKTIAEALDVSPRTIRRWIATRKLIAHQIDGVVRITDADFRAFLALHRRA
jgi:excisionase family DNA binding protein